mmetsp:Transcript_11039/g.32723  ORF Transcript_11039/g.32723 Transcript_11039/m.32723 type:complete len:308 (+) Transcript_11039:128-1051(+)
MRRRGGRVYLLRETSHPFGRSGVGEAHVQIQDRPLRPRRGTQLQLGPARPMSPPDEGRRMGRVLRRTRRDVPPIRRRVGQILRRGGTGARRVPSRRRLRRSFNLVQNRPDDRHRTSPRRPAVLGDRCGDNDHVSHRPMGRRVGPDDRIRFHRRYDGGGGERRDQARFARTVRRHHPEGRRRRRRASERRPGRRGGASHEERQIRGRGRYRGVQAGGSHDRLPHPRRPTDRGGCGGNQIRSGGYARQISVSFSHVRRRDGIDTQQERRTGVVSEMLCLTRNQRRYAGRQRRLRHIRPLLFPRRLGGNE